ncbi:MAG: YbhB/YbcL family Raf kinase inhibitor-like protein, partial [Actinomycetales bacterium]|nr:YbhB/YbcL family Raf kinase inhibitor-like protein [Actinomycetales bacterium]
MPRSSHRAALAVLGLSALLGMLAACSPGTSAPSPAASESAPAAAFTLSSTDFTDGSELAEEFTADAFSGQCRGENLNPALSWEGAPAGTVSFAVTMVDVSADDFVHWLHAGIPADVTSVGSGAAGELPGVAGQSATGQFGYFGPCPPTPDHEYVFTVHALDVDP